MSRISRNKQIMSGMYCIRGTRIPVVLIKAYLRTSSASAIARDYGHISVADVKACAKFRAREAKP